MQNLTTVTPNMDFVGYPDGITPVNFVAGQQYEIPSHVANNFKNGGLVAIDDEPAPATPNETGGNGPEVTPNETGGNKTDEGNAGDLQNESQEALPLKELKEKLGHQRQDETKKLLKSLGLDADDAKGDTVIPADFVAKALKTLENGEQK